MSHDCHVIIYVGYHADHPVILWFWKAVEMFDNEQRLRLLQVEYTMYTYICKMWLMSSVIFGSLWAIVWLLYNNTL